MQNSPDHFDAANPPIIIPTRNINYQFGNELGPYFPLLVVKYAIVEVSMPTASSITDALREKVVEAPKKLPPIHTDNTSSTPVKPPAIYGFQGFLNIISPFLNHE